MASAAIAIIAQARREIQHHFFQKMLFGQIGPSLSPHPTRLGLGSLQRCWNAAALSAKALTAIGLMSLLMTTTCIAAIVVSGLLLSS